MRTAHAVVTTTPAAGAGTLLLLHMRETRAAAAADGRGNERATARSMDHSVWVPGRVGVNGGPHAHAELFTSVHEIHSQRSARAHGAGLHTSVAVLPRP